MGKNILVTGASSGIGLETSRLLTQEGHTIIMVSRHIVEQNIIINGTGNYFFYNADISKQEEVTRLFDWLTEKNIELDAIINNAGFVEPEGIFDTSFENWNKTIETNLTGTFLVAQIGAKHMKLRGGHIINISSTAGLSPRPGWAAYAAAKSGVINFSMAIAEELKMYGIRVFIICPGRTATPLRKILAPEENPKTIMQPESVAKIIKMCLSDEAGVLEGQPIIVRDRF